MYPINNPAMVVTPFRPSVPSMFTPWTNSTETASIASGCHQLQNFRCYQPCHLSMPPLTNLPWPFSWPLGWPSHIFSPTYGYPPPNFALECFSQPPLNMNLPQYPMFFMDPHLEAPFLLHHSTLSPWLPTPEHSSPQLGAIVSPPPTGDGIPAVSAARKESPPPTTLPCNLVNVGSPLKATTPCDVTNVELSPKAALLCTSPLSASTSLLIETRETSRNVEWQSPKVAAYLTISPSEPSVQESPSVGSVWDEDHKKRPLKKDELLLFQDVGPRKIDVIVYKGYEHRRERGSQCHKYNQKWVCRHAKKTKCKGKFKLTVRDLTNFLEEASITSFCEHNHEPLPLTDLVSETKDELTFHSPKQRQY